MVETTMLVVAGKKLSVPRLLKRLLQVAIAVALTAGVLFVVIAGNGFLVGRTTFQAGVTAWLAFVRRPDILTTMVLTAVVTVLFVSWQRDRERRSGGANRPSI
jgi:ABC-type sulfate transport system permease subunit